MVDSVLIWAVIAAALGVTIVRTAVIIVRQGYEYTLERFGKYQTTLRPGFHYFVAQKYVEALSDFAKGPNTKTLLLPMEATGILSSLAGIAEVARETFNKDERS